MNTIGKRGMIEMEDNDAKYWLNKWNREFCPDYLTPIFTGFCDLGPTTRGRTSFYGRCYGNGADSCRYGKIAMSNRLHSDWRIKATLWHEFCHHWEWVETGKHGHGKGFDARVRRKPELWVLCAISRCLPM